MDFTNAGSRYRFVRMGAAVILTVLLLDWLRPGTGGLLGASMHDQTPPFVLEWAANAFFTAIAAIGGFLGHVSRQMTRGEKVRFSNAIIEALGSGFLGFLCLLTCKAMGLDTNWTGAIVGLMGWIGASAAGAILEKIVRARLGVAPPAEKSE